ncbi:MAG: hypothetical protein E6H66_11320, partial [Betaproteobacteria bacterium]
MNNTSQGLQQAALAPEHTMTLRMVKLAEAGLRSLPRSVAVLFLCALVVVVVEAVISQYVMRSVAETAEAIMVARAQLDQLDQARDLLIDAETGVRGLLLFGRQEYLDPYNSAAARANNVLNDIARDRGPDERASADQFTALARAKLEELGQVLELYRSGDRNRAVQMLATSAEKRSMDSLRELVRARRDLLEQRVEDSRAQRTQFIRWAFTANVLAAILAMLVLAFFGSAILRHLFRRQKLEQKIQSANVELESMVAQRTKELKGAVDAMRSQL